MTARAEGSRRHDGNVIHVDFAAERARRCVPAAEHAESAYRLYMMGSKLDEDPATLDRALALYREALAIDPRLAIALTNIGNILFRRGDDAGAEQVYREAVAIDDRQPEAHYNLGYVMLERGEASRAEQHLADAVACDPRFADAWFNLGMARECVGKSALALEAFEAYLRIETAGTWADIARAHAATLRAQLAPPEPRRARRRATRSPQLEMPSAARRAT